MNVLIQVGIAVLIAIGIHIAVLYFTIKAAVRNGIQEAREDILEDIKNEKT